MTTMRNVLVQVAALVSSHRSLLPFIPPPPRPTFLSVYIVALHQAEIQTPAITITKLSSPLQRFLQHQDISIVGFPSFQPTRKLPFMAGPTNSKASRKKSAPATLPRCAHSIQFYEAESFLYDAVSRFILPSFFSTENAAVIVATRLHLDGLEAHLREQNLAPGLLKERGQLVLVDADALLPSLLDGGKVNNKVFETYFGGVFANIRKQYPRILAYGELVNILCEQGNHLLAHELEQVWERFLAAYGRDVSLLCGYDMAVFEADGLSDVFQQICLSHSHVVPGEKKFPLLGDSQDRSTIVAMLQQQTRCLEAEVNRRKISEAALQTILDHFSAPSIETRTQSHGQDGHHDSVPVGICGRTSYEGRSQYFVNERFCEISGLREHQIRLDGNWLSAVHHLDRERVSRCFSFEDGRLRKQDYRFVHANGEVRWVSAEFTVNVYGYVHTIVDTTQIRGIQDQTHQSPSIVQQSQKSNDYGKLLADTYYPDTRRPVANENKNRQITDSVLRRNEHGKSGESKSLHAISVEHNRRILMDRIPIEFENISKLLSGIAKDDSLSQHSFNFVTIKTHMEKLQVWYDCLPDTLALHLVTIGHSMLPAQKSIMLQAYCAYLRSIIILTRRVLIKVATTATRSTCAQEGGSLEVFFANKCISAARGLCKILDLIFSGNRQLQKGWLTISSAFTACVIVFLDISLRSDAESANSDNLTEIIPRCIDALKSSPRLDHRICKRYLETLIPFWMALKPPLASEILPKRTPPSDLTLSSSWVTLESSWVTTWTHGRACAITDDLLCILKEPCGSVDHKDWEERSWDWRFLLPPDSPPTTQNTVSTTNQANPPWLDASHKKKAKRSKDDNDSSSQSQSSRYSSPESHRSAEARGASLTQVA